MTDTTQTHVHRDTQLWTRISGDFTAALSEAVKMVEELGEELVTSLEIKAQQFVSDEGVKDAYYVEVSAQFCPGGHSD